MRLTTTEVHKAVDASNDEDGSIYRKSIEDAEREFAHAAANSLPFVLITIYPDRVMLQASACSQDVYRAANSLVGLLENADIIQDAVAAGVGKDI